MKRSITFIALSICVLVTFIYLGSRSMLAQDSLNDRDSDQKSHRPSSMENQRPSTSKTLGAPGMTFQYVQQFGETAVGYIEDTNHFYEVWGVATNGNNLWLTDSWGNRVVKFDSDGNFLQQIGKAGFRDGIGTSLDFLADIGVDQNGNTWVVDAGANHIVKFNAAGEMVGELGKVWESGNDNSHFDSPISIAFDQLGNIYVSDSGLWGEYGNHRVQIFNSNGEYLSTIGESGVAGSDNNHLRNPRRIAIEGTQLFIADSGNHRVQVFDISTATAATYVATLGTTGEIGEDNAHFNEPQGLGVDANFIYVADSYNHRIQIFQRTTRSFVGSIGSFGDGTGQFDHPTDVAIDSSGRIYVADAWNKRVQQFLNGNYLRTYGTTDVAYVTDNNHYLTPAGVAIAQDGSMYIGEERGHRLIKLSAAGIVQWIVGQPGAPSNDNQHFAGITDIDIDAAGRVYIADFVNHRIQIFTSDGIYVATIGNEQGTNNDQLNYPRGVAIGKDGNIIVADSENHRLQIYDANRNYLRTIGRTGESGNDNTHFNYPEDVATDDDGNIYVADHYNHRVQIFTSSGGYLRTIGVSGECGRDFDHFCDPIAIEVDKDGRIYVADGWGKRVQVFDAVGAYLTTIPQRGDKFPNVAGIALDNKGNLFLAEWLNHRILKYALGAPPGWTQTNINGFGHPQTLGIVSLSAIKGVLYASTSSWDGSGARRLMRSTDGSNWSEAIGSSAGSVYNAEFTQMAEFKSKLYVGTANFNWEKQHTEGGELWRSDDGLAWSTVITGGFDSVDNDSISHLTVFENYLYVATLNYSATRGFDLWRSSTGDALDWTRVVTNGFGDSKNWLVPTLEIFNNTLYAGTSNDLSGGELWRSQDGIHWAQVYLDGFGNAKSDVVGSLEVFRGQLYAGLRNFDTGGEIWRSPDGDQWTKVVSGGLGNIKNARPYNLTSYAGHLYVTFGNQETGMEVWRSANGTSWQQISANGWGDINNFFPVADQATTVFNGQLYVGTWNEANGGELWRYTSDSVSLTIDNPALASTLLYTDSQGDLTQIQLPAGAVTASVELLYTPLTSASPPAGFVFANHGFSLTAFRSNQLQSGFTFAQPVFVTIHYQDSDMIVMDEAKVRLLWLNPQTQGWEEAACGNYVRQPAQNQLTVPICHLSQFSLFGETKQIFLPLVTR